MLQVFLGEGFINDFLGLIFKEMRVGMILGVIYGVFLGIVAYFGFVEPPLLGVVVCISIFFCMTMAATVGTLIPLVLKRFDIPELNVVKISMPRPNVQGSREDRDMHASQWAWILAELEIE